MHTFRFPGIFKTGAFLLFIWSFFAISCDQTGTTTTFSGTITDVLTKKPLQGVSVTVMPFNLGKETDEEGVFSIALPRTDEYVYLVFSKPGYDPQETLKMPLSPRKKNLYTFKISMIRRVALAVLSTEEIDFGGKNTDIAVVLSNPGNDTLHWNFLDLYFPSWLQAKPMGGELLPEEEEELLFTCDRSGLEIGPYAAEVQLLGGEKPLILSVDMLVEGSLLKVTNTYFDFGEEDTQGVTLLSNEGNIPLSWHLKDVLPDWVVWEQTEGTIDSGKEQSVAVSVNRNVLDYGNYTYRTTLLSDGGDTSYVFLVSKTKDLLQVSPKTIDFGTQNTHRTFTVSRLTGVHPVDFEIDCTDENLSFSPSRGTITQEEQSAAVEVMLNRENIPAGASASTVFITYGEEELKVTVNYATAAIAPDVTSDGHALDNSYRLYFKGTLVSNGGGSVVEHGHCWSSVPNPKVPWDKDSNPGETTGGETGYTKLGSLEEGASFVSYPTTLPEHGTTWYIRAYAENEMGISYGEIFTITYYPPRLEGLVVRYEGITDVLIFREQSIAGLPFTEHGFVWNTTGGMPTVESDAHVLLGEKTAGSQFFYNFPKPSRGFEYTVRSFAINESGRTYSTPVTFYLDIEEPVVVTSEVEDIQYYAATLNGTLEVRGSEEILACGHCWSSYKEKPTLEDNHSNLGTLAQAGSFKTPIKNLIINTQYYYTSYVRTTKGVYYGRTQAFTTKKDESVVVQDGLNMFITVNDERKAYDWTGKAHDLVISSGINYKFSGREKPGQVPAAISFNGTSAYLYSKNINPLSGISKGSINFWLCFPNGMRTDEKYPFIGSDHEDGMFFMISHDGKNWVLTMSMGPGKETYSATLPSIGDLNITSILGRDWHMLTVVSNGTTMTLYMDGVKMPMDDMNIPMAFGVQNDLVIGAHALDGSTLNTFLKADMAALRFYDRMLSGAEVASIYNAEQ